MHDIFQKKTKKDEKIPELYYNMYKVSICITDTYWYTIQLYKRRLHKMKRFTAILLTGMMIFTLASCGKKAQDTPTEPATETQAAEKVEMPTETEAVTEVVTEAAKETQQTEQQEVPSQEDSKQEETKTEETKKEDIKAETIDNKTEVKKLDQVGYVSADGLVVRKEPSTSSEELDSLSKNDKVVITGKIDGWYQIKLNGKTGYVSAKYISDTKIKDTKIKETTSRSGSTIKQEEVTPMDVEETTQKEEKVTTTSKSNTSVVEYAKNYLGCKYVSGGSSPTTGFDCSGFTSYVYKNFGVSLSRSSKGQINDGVAVSKDELQPGDIVVFNNSGNSAIGHVGIYIGGDSFIHAANPRQGVVITSLSSSYYSKRYVGARRVK